MALDPASSWGGESKTQGGSPITARVGAALPALLWCSDTPLTTWVPPAPCQAPAEQVGLCLFAELPSTQQGCARYLPSKQTPRQNAKAAATTQPAENPSSSRILRAGEHAVGLGISQRSRCALPRAERRGAPPCNAPQGTNGLLGPRARCWHTVNQCQLNHRPPGPAGPSSSSAPYPHRCTQLFLPDRRTLPLSSHNPTALLPAQPHLPSPWPLSDAAPKAPHPNPPLPQHSITHQRVPFGFSIADDRHGAHHVLGGRGAAGPSRHGHGHPGKAQLHGAARARAAAPGAPHPAAGRGTAPRGGPDRATPQPAGPPARVQPPRRPQASPRPPPARAVRPPSLVSAKGAGAAPLDEVAVSQRGNGRSYAGGAKSRIG